MNLAKYGYFELNIAEVENVVEMLHERTDSYLEMMEDPIEKCKTAEDMKKIMIEYMRAVRNQANILSTIKNRLESTNLTCNAGGDINRDEITKEMVKGRYV